MRFILFAVICVRRAESSEAVIGNADVIMDGRAVREVAQHVSEGAPREGVVALTPRGKAASKRAQRSPRRLPGRRAPPGNVALLEEGRHGGLRVRAKLRGGGGGGGGSISGSGSGSGMRAVIVCALMAVTVVMTVGVVVMMVVMVATPCAVVVAVVVATPCAEGAEGKEHEHGSFDSFEERLIFGNRNSRSREVEAKIDPNNTTSGVPLRLVSTSLPES